MTSPLDGLPRTEPSPEALEALTQRLSAVAALVFDDPAPVPALAARGPGVLGDALARHAQRVARDDITWLTLVAFSASFPTTEQLLRTRRALSLAKPFEALSCVLDSVYRSGRPLRALERTLRVVTDRVVADVDFCARFDHNTGIQRVVRETMARWNRTHDRLEFVCWTEGDNAFREISPLERRRVVAWDEHKATLGGAKAHARAVGTSGADESPDAGHPLVVPFGTTVLLPEVAHEGLWPGLAALARFSGNRVGVVGYDTIPIASADLIASIESEKFAKYLTVVKSADRVAAISESAAVEFRGFAAAAAAQGVPTPEVVTVTLAVQGPERGLPRLATGGGMDASTGASAAASTPLVLIVGNQEARKNLLAVLFAAEMLWREGVRFRLRMIGGGNSYYTRLIDREVSRLTAAGYPVELLRRAGDDVLVDSYRQARFTVFPSTHEGYGLPVAESVAMGVPSLTSNYGSTQQIADGGGCVTVDPRDDDAIIRAMRSLITDDALHDRLVAEARARTPRSWDDYATELWRDLVEPLEGTPA